MIKGNYLKIGKISLGDNCAGRAHMDKEACHVKTVFLFVWIILTIPGGQDFVFAMGLDGKKLKIVGGPCEYKTYKGSATIVSIHKKKGPKNYGGAAHESYGVKFSVSTEEEIKEPYARVDGKQYTLKLTNSWYPGPRFLEKYGIQEGKVFECHVKVITKGTCTPIDFDFPDIDRSDYFEINK